MKEVECKVEKCMTGFHWVMKNMKNLRIVEHCHKMLVEIKDFKNMMPMMKVLTHPGMCDRHWMKICEQTKINVNCRCSFRNLMTMGIMNHYECCCEISCMAEKEHNICEMMKKIK